MKKKILYALPVTLLLLILVGYSLVLGGKKPLNGMSRHIEHVEVGGKDNFYYADSFKLLEFEQKVYMTWRDEDSLFVHNINSTQQVNTKIDSVFNELKALKYRIEEGEAILYSLEGEQVYRSSVELETGKVRSKDLYMDHVVDMSVTDYYEVFQFTDGGLKVLSVGQELYSVASGVKNFAADDHDVNLLLAYQSVEVENLLKAMKITPDGIEDVMELHNDSIIADKSLYNAYMDEENLGVFVRERRRGSVFNTTYYMMVRPDSNGEIEYISSIRNDILDDPNLLAIDGEYFIFGEVLKGNVFFTKERVGTKKISEAKQWSKTRSYSRNLRYLQSSQGDEYIAWEERGDDNKLLCYASNNDLVMQRATKLTLSDFGLLLMNTLMLVVVSALPTFFLLIYLVPWLLGALAVLKIVLKDGFKYQQKIVCRVTSVVLLIGLGSYMLYYGDNFFGARNILQQVISSRVFILGYIPLILMAVLSSYIANRKEKSIIAKYVTFGIYIVGFVVLYTMPNYAMGYYGMRLY